MSTLPARSAVRTDTHPRIEHPDAALVAVTEFELADGGAQQALFEASAAAWAILPWPETLLSITWLAGTDGRRALAYAQWRGDAGIAKRGLAPRRAQRRELQPARPRRGPRPAVRGRLPAGIAAFGRTHRPILSAHFAKAVPGLKAEPVTFYRRYRSAATPDAPVPGCIVAVTATFDGPDAGRQAAWVDAVFDALASEASLPAGGLAAHFHLSTDGTRVLNWTEWVDEASHREALARSGQGAIGAGAKWRAVQAWPGLTAGRVTRYRLDRRLVAADVAPATD